MQLNRRGIVTNSDATRAGIAQSYPRSDRFSHTEDLLDGPRLGTRPGKKAGTRREGSIAAFPQPDAVLSQGLRAIAAAQRS